MNEMGTKKIAAVEFRDVRLARRRKTVLTIDQLSLASNEPVAIIGPNGAGKSTLLAALLGLLPPTSGIVMRGTDDVSRTAPRTRARWFAYVPQMIASVPELTVGAIVAGGRFRFGTGELANPSALDDVSLAAMQRCGVADYRDRAFRQLSVGERQRVLLAAALAQDSEQLVLDEPNAALDPAFATSLVEILREWHGRARGYVLVTHDLQLVNALQPRVIGIRNGAIVCDGPCETVLTPDRLETLFGTPFATYRAGGQRTLALPAWPE